MFHFRKDYAKNDNHYQSRSHPQTFLPIQSDELCSCYIDRGNILTIFTNNARPSVLGLIMTIKTKKKQKFPRHTCVGLCQLASQQPLPYQLRCFLCSVKNLIHMRDARGTVRIFNNGSGAERSPTCWKMDADLGGVHINWFSPPGATLSFRLANKLLERNAFALHLISLSDAFHNVFLFCPRCSFLAPFFVFCTQQNMYSASATRAFVSVCVCKCVWWNIARDVSTFMCWPGASQLAPGFIALVHRLTEPSSLPGDRPSLHRGGRGTLPRKAMGFAMLGGFPDTRSVSYIFMAAFVVSSFQNLILLDARFLDFDFGWAMWPAMVCEPVCRGGVRDTFCPRCIPCGMFADAQQEAPSDPSVCHSETGHCLWKCYGYWNVLSKLPGVVVDYLRSAMFVLGAGKWNGC